MTMLREFLLLTGFGLVACGSNDSGEGDGPTGSGGATTSTGGTPSTGGSGGNAGLSGNPGASGAAPLDGGNSGVTPETLFPLAVGNQWNFQMTVTGPNPPCAAGPVTIAVTKTGTVRGRPAFATTDTCFGPGDDSVNAGQIESISGSQWNVTLASPVQDGHSWPWQGTTLTWQRVGTVSVPAGTFSECWARVPSNPAEATATYCNHVGPVRYVAPNWKQELVSYSLK
jgi:hypothetical protein